MSAKANNQTIRVSNHAVERFVQRIGWGAPGGIEYRFREGSPVDVEGKVYTEARLVEVGGTRVILLRKGTHITTVLYAREEQITKLDDRPLRAERE